MNESVRIPRYVLQISDRTLDFGERKGNKALAGLFRQQMDQILGDANYQSFDFDGVFDVWARDRYRPPNQSLLYSEDWPDAIPSNYPGYASLSRKQDTYDIHVAIWPGFSVHFSLQDDKPRLSMTVGTEYGKEDKPVKDDRLRTQTQKLKYGIFLLTRLHDAFIEPETIFR